MAINKTLHYNAKELLLYIAIVLAAEGALVIRNDVWTGVAVLLAALAVVFARGAYKKFLGNGKEEEKDEELPPPPPPKEELQP